MMTNDDKIRLQVACKAARALYTNATAESQLIGAAAAGAVIQMCKEAGDAPGAGLAVDVLMLALGSMSLMTEDRGAWESIHRRVTLAIVHEAEREQSRPRETTLKDPAP